MSNPIHHFLFQDLLGYTCVTRENKKNGITYPHFMKLKHRFIFQISFFVVLK